ncbi:MAG: response regulator transcription factor [Acidimicrobiales bacterium]
MAEETGGTPATAPITVLIVDDHPIVRQGLRTYLSSRPGLEVVGEASDGDEAVAEAARLGPDIVLLDLVMPRAGGVEAIRRLRGGGERPRVVVLTSFAGDDQVVEAVRAGAVGYLLKDVPPAELEAAIRLVHQGGVLLDPSVVGSLMAEVARAEPPPGLGELTARERQVLALLAQGRSNRDLAAELYVSEKTVKTHVSSILAKLRLTDRTQAALFAVRHGLATDADPEPGR